VIDIHCHLLPGIDDGPPTLEASLALAKELVHDGVSHVVCTPHVFPGRFENRSSNIEEEFDRFSKVIEKSGIPLGITWAGEVRLTAEVLDLLTKSEVPFLGELDGYRIMLLEMPDGQVPLGADKFTQRMLTMGIRPIIVHPERNRGVMERPERLRGFVEDGCFVQLTAGSLVGQFGDNAKRVAHELMENGWVHAVASDAHNLAGRRPRMRDAFAHITQRWGETTAQRLMLFSPAAMCGLELGEQLWQDTEAPSP
jgi:protein-tyrosine phosphatase